MDDLFSCDFFFYSDYSIGPNDNFEFKKRNKTKQKNFP